MIGWFKKREQKAARAKRRRLPVRSLAPVEEIVDQGVLVADVAVRMTVKNEIIMNALKTHADYDEEHIVGLVRRTARQLADERDRDAAHISEMLGEIRNTGRSAFSETEYGHDDNRTLRHRRDVYERVAIELRARSEDEGYLRDTAERARELAWREIGDSLKDRAMHPYYSGGGSDDYRRSRDDRIMQFIEKDLTELIMDQGRKRSKAKRSI